MVDSVFSFGELGFQEFETSKYLTGILEKEGFKVERGFAGIPTAWIATWGEGKPVISLGSDIDDIPQASQKPGVAYHDPMIEGAPGHGEGHNSGVPLNIIAAIAVKKVMEREHLQGTIRLWPGVAEELVGTKAYFVRAGMFKDVDICLFTHVANNSGRFLGTQRAERPGVDRIHVQGRKRTRRRSAVARPQRAGCGRTDGRRLQFPARASAAGHARPQRDHQWRRPAERGSSERGRLVLLPRSRLRPHHEPVAHRRQHGQGGDADDRYELYVAPAGQRVARATSTSRSPRRCTRTSRRSACRRGRTTIRSWRRRFRRN